jgi:hypothetical protein
MIAQHFIRSPSLRQKLQDRYAGLELVSGKYLSIFFNLIMKYNFFIVLVFLGKFLFFF